MEGIGGRRGSSEGGLGVGGRGGGGIVQPTNDHPSSVFEAVLIFPPILKLCFFRFVVFIIIIIILIESVFEESSVNSFCISGDWGRMGRGMKNIVIIRIIYRNNFFDSVKGIL